MPSVTAAEHNWCPVPTSRDRAGSDVCGTVRGAGPADRVDLGVYQPLGERLQLHPKQVRLGPVDVLRHGRATSILGAAVMAWFSFCEVF